MIFTCSRRTSASRSRRRSSRAFVCLQKRIYSSRESPRAAQRGRSQRGLSALRFKWGRRRGQTKRRERGSSGSAAPRRRQRKKKKKPFGELFGSASRRRRRKRTLASSFNLMSRYLSSLSKLSAPTGFGFPSYAWCTRYCTPPIAVMAPTMMANGGKDSNGCDWFFRATTARRSADGVEGRREVSAAGGYGPGSGGDACRARVRAKTRRLHAGSSSLASPPHGRRGVVVRAGGAYHVRFCFGSRDAAGVLARGATLQSACEGRWRASGAITGRRVTSATLRALE